MTLALVCGVCKKSLSEMVGDGHVNLVHAPCGHVFHHACISKFFETNVDENGKTYCHNCKQKCDESNLIKLYPIYREETLQDPVSQKGPSTQTGITWMNYIVAYALFIFVIFCGKGHLAAQKYKFDTGDDELHELGTYMGNTWAVLFGIAGLAAMMYDSFS